MVRPQLHSILPHLQNTVVTGKDVVIQDDALRKHNKIEGPLAFGIRADCCVGLLVCVLGDLALHPLMLHLSVAHPIASGRTLHHDNPADQWSQLWKLL
jgi:hypothetical protein